MSTSFARSADERFLTALKELKNAGATVTLTTQEGFHGVGQLFRSATITWQTHSGIGAVL